MAVYKDYEIRINLNELVEKMIPVCDVLHPDHCLTVEQVDQIAHGLREDIDLSSVYAQAEAEIKNYCDKFGVELPK
jgi:hypothetical protein